MRGGRRLGARHRFETSHFILMCLTNSTQFVPILQMWQLRLREVK